MFFCAKFTCINNKLHFSISIAVRMYIYNYKLYLFTVQPVDSVLVLEHWGNSRYSKLGRAFRRTQVVRVDSSMTAFNIHPHPVATPVALSRPSCEEAQRHLHIQIVSLRTQ